MSNYPSQPGYPQQPGGTYPPGPGWPPPREGMGCGMKLLIAFGICFAVLFVVCCGVVGYGIYYFRNAVTEDPAKVVATANGITGIEAPARLEIPAALRPVAAADFKIPITGQQFMLFAVFADQTQHSTLILFGLGDMFDSQDKAQLRQSIDQSLRKQGVRSEKGEELVQRQEYRKELLIRGEQVAFTIAKGIGAQSKTPRIQVQGLFPGKTGQVMLLLDASQQSVSEEDAVRMLESLK